MHTSTPCRQTKLLRTAVRASEPHVQQGPPLSDYVWSTGGLELWKPHYKQRAGALTQHPDGVKRADEVLKLPLQRLEVWSVFEGKVHPIPCRVELERRFSLRDVIRHGNLQLGEQKQDSERYTADVC